MVPGANQFPFRVVQFPFTRFSAVGVFAFVGHMARPVVTLPQAALFAALEFPGLPKLPALAIPFPRTAELVIHETAGCSELTVAKVEFPHAVALAIDVPPHAGEFAGAKIFLLQAVQRFLFLLLRGHEWKALNRVPARSAIQHEDAIELTDSSDAHGSRVMHAERADLSSVSSLAGLSARRSRGQRLRAPDVLRMARETIELLFDLPFCASKGRVTPDRGSETSQTRSGSVRQKSSRRVSLVEPVHIARNWSSALRARGRPVPAATQMVMSRPHSGRVSPESVAPGRLHAEFLVWRSRLLNSRSSRKSSDEMQAPGHASFRGYAAGCAVKPWRFPEFNRTPARFLRIKPGIPGFNRMRFNRCHRARHP